ncbi:MAG TPA: hypothetical protein VGX78_15515 [Pirellulales bacterium]|nr:hypothetical protein [Pirellulales bacterium]
MRIHVRISVCLAVSLLAAGPAAAQHHAGFHPGLYTMGWAPHSHQHGHWYPFGYFWGVPAYGFYGPYSYSYSPLTASYFAGYATSGAPTLTSREEARRVSHAARRAERLEARQRRAQQRAAQGANHAGLQKRLDPALIVRHGRVVWPALLQAENYQAGRETLERLLADAAHSGPGGAGSESAPEVKRLATELTAELKRHIKEVNSNDYLNAKRFLDSLVDERPRSAVVEQLAAN